MLGNILVLYTHVDQNAKGSVVLVTRSLRDFVQVSDASRLIAARLAVIISDLHSVYSSNELHERRAFFMHSDFLCRHQRDKC